MNLAGLYYSQIKALNHSACIQLLIQVISRMHSIIHTYFDRGTKHNVMHTSVSTHERIKQHNTYQTTISFQDYRIDAMLELLGR